MNTLSSPTLESKLRQIRLLVCDVDGVLTDGRLIIGDDGQEYKAFHSRDGHGLRMLADSGVTLAILTGRKSNVVTRRAQDLGIPYVIQGRRDKAAAFDDLLKTVGMKAHETAYIGDDVLDLPVMRRCIVGFAVANAHPLVQKEAGWVSTHDGGQGAVREICELIMRCQGTWSALMDQYLLD